MTIVEKPAASDAAAESTAPPAEGTPAPAKRGSGLRILLGLFVLLILGGSAGGGIWWWLNRPGGGGAPAAGNAGPMGAAVLPEPAGPPTPVKFELAALGGAEAAGPSNSAASATIGRLPALAAKLASDLHSLPIDPTAPAQFIVPGGGRPSAGDNSIVPRHQRWQFDSPPGSTIETYTRQLDFFKIEIGVIGGSDQVVYLSSLSEPAPKKRTGPASGEKRLYLTWQRGSMREADELLAARAQVPIAGRVVAHFCPPEVEALLVAVEDAHAQKAGYQKIRRTVFGIKSSGPEGFVFHVVEQSPDES